MKIFLTFAYYLEYYVNTVMSTHSLDVFPNYEKFFQFLQAFPEIITASYIDGSVCRVNIKILHK